MTWYNDLLKYISWGNKRKIAPTRSDIPYLPVLESQRLLFRTDIAAWREAHQLALDISRPRRDLLMQVYADATLDTTLQAKLQTRTLNILNTPFALFKADGSIDPNKTNELKTIWFYKILTGIAEELFYGYTLLQLDIDRNNQIKDVFTIPRQNIIPDFNSVLIHLESEQLVDFTTPAYQNLYLWFCSDYKKMGLLLECARFTIIKKHAIAHWSQFQELFGIPFRYATTNIRDPKVLDTIENNLKEMGAAGYAIFPEATKIEILEKSGSDPHSVFDECIKMANQEISNRILGNAESQNDKGSYAREKVYRLVQEDINEADLRMVELNINNKVLPVLNAWNYDFKNLTFKFNVSWKLPLANNQLEIDQWLATLYDLDEKYISDTYGVPVSKKIQVKKKEGTHKKEDASEVTATTTPLEPLNAQTNPSTLMPAIMAYDEAVCQSCANQQMVAQNHEEIEMDYNGWMGGIEKFLEGLRNNSKLELNEALFFSKLKNYQKAVEKGTQQDWLSLSFDTPNYQMYAQMRQNIYYFNAASNYSNLKAIQDVLFENGKPVSFKTFKDNIDTYIAQTDAINQKYNKTWLKTEYNFAINQSEANRRWVEFENNAESFPYLTYKAVKDDRTRLTHQSLHGITLPIDDVFWDTYAPLNGWNCRCRLIATNTPPSEDQTLPQPQIAEQFKYNPAKQGVVFKETHPFFEQQKQTNDAIRNRANEFFLQENARINQKIYNDFKDDDFEKIRFNQQTGGYLIEHKKAQKLNLDNNDHKKELEAIELLVENGFRVVRPEYFEGKEFEYVKNYDVEINDSKCDIKSPKEDTKKAYEKLYSNAKEQASNVIFYVSNNFNIGNFINATSSRFNSKDVVRNLNFTHVVLLHKEKPVLALNRKEIKNKSVMTQIITTWWE